MNFSLGRPQRQWLIAFLLFILLLPLIFATLIVGLGNALGCQMVGKTAQICLVNGLNIGQTIKKLVDWTWYLPVVGMFQVPILTIGLFVGLLVLIYKSFRGWPRALVGFFSVWYMCFAPLIAGIVFVAYLSGQAQCSLNAGGVGTCYLFGVNMGDTFHSVAVFPWIMIFLFGFCTITSVIYVVIALVNHKQSEQG